MGGHPGVARTLDLLKCHYEGPRLAQFVEEYVQGYAKCQEVKTLSNRRKAPLVPFDIHIDQGPFQYVSIDLITDLPPSQGYDTILTIIDQGCSKAATFLPCKKTIDGEEVARLYMQHLLPWFGLPKCIISDRDPHFTS
jgi:Integrase zinc binding domain